MIRPRDGNHDSEAETRFVALDIGGTKIMAASADASGAMVRIERASTPLKLNDGLRVIDELIAKVSGGKPIGGIGAAAGGPLDWRTGVVSPLHQPEWRDVRLKERMEERWGCRFEVDVDTNVAALGEYHQMARKPARLLYLTISTGMGGGFVVDGRIYRGKDGGHPEVGHQSVHYRCSAAAVVSCSCGATGCLEALVSGNGIRRHYLKAPEELSDGEWEEIAWNLGQGLRNLAAIYAPDTIILGGGVVFGAGDRFLQRAVEVMRANLKIVQAPDVSRSLLGENNVLQGALLLARTGQAP
jgi:predicted NBD/HSP70 family sugar kinase